MIHEYYPESETVARNVKCETVIHQLPDANIWCPKQALKLVDCFLGEGCMFYPRKHKHALCLEHYDQWKDWRKKNG